MQSIKSTYGKVFQKFFQSNELEELYGSFADEVRYAENCLSIQDREQISYKGSKNLDNKIQLDVLLTFAESRLDKISFSNLLLELSKECILEGENNLALRLLDKAFLKGNNKNKAEVFLSKAEIYSRQADWDLSLKFVNEAMSSFNRLDNKIGIARAANLTGTIFGDKGDLDKASNSFNQALDAIKDETECELKGLIHINFGIISNLRAEYNAALRYFLSALEIFEKLDDKRRISEVSLNLGMTFFRLNNITSALNYLDHSIYIGQNLEMFSILGVAYLNKAVILISQDDYKSAEAFANKALGISYTIDDKLSIAEVFKLKGIIERKFENHEVSENYLLTSLRINRECKNKYNEAEVLNELGILYLEMNKPVESESNFKAAIKYFKIINAVNEIRKIDYFLQNCKNILQNNLLT